LSVAREREQGTFDQLLVTPFRPFEIMVGKAIPNMVIGLTQSTTILLIAQFWFKIPFVGSFAVLYAGLGLFLMAAVGLGLFVSSIAKTMQQAMLYAFLLVMPFALLSGLTTPINSMPEFLQSVMVINPLRYALDLTKRVYLEDAGFAQLISDFLPLARHRRGDPLRRRVAVQPAADLALQGASPRGGAARWRPEAHRTGGCRDRGGRRG
jgi:ABC-2 type transport system permease protein